MRKVFHTLLSRYILIPLQTKSPSFQGVAAQYSLTPIPSMFRSFFSCGSSKLICIEANDKYFQTFAIHCVNFLQSKSCAVVTLSKRDVWHVSTTVSDN